ncbi:MAG TPA: phosphotransferase family protein [Caulobacteraceae bacterium]|jgi:aminoglycoside phosphotransferase (APT) family kinase protein
MANSDLADLVDGLVRRRLGGEGASGIARLSAGATQEIWRFNMIAAGTEVPLILRRAPGGGLRLSETAVGLETEARLIETAAGAGVPVPLVRCVLEPEDGLGHGFVMGFVDGETLGGRIARGEALAETRKFLARQCGEILARIHTLNPADFPNLRRAAPAEYLAQYTDIYHRSAWPRPVFELAIRWLGERCPPPPEAPKLVHGDFRNGNLMIGPEGVRAVLDWEIAHVADPMEDLGWICVGSWRFGVDHLPVGGFGLREDLWAGYEAAGGAPVRREHALWWEVFGSLRWGIMCAGMAGAFRTVDPNIERAVIARRASETEVDLMRLIAA